MNEASTIAGSDTRVGPRPREFIALMAALMATNAMAIDMMLPALPDMARTLDMGPANNRQLVVTFFLFGFGAGQIFFGPLSDRFGRKTILLTSLVFYGVFAALCAVAESFALLLAARALHGIAAAATRVLAISIIRDRYHGTEMAKVLSFVSIVFMLIPIFAPSIGQALLAVTHWRAIFLVFAVYALVMLFWAGLRLPETLPLERRRPLSLVKVREAMAITLSHRASIGNTLAITLVMGALFGFINSIQQIVFDVFHRGALIGIIFACIASTMAASSFLNTRIVEALGTRRVMLIGLYAMITFSGIHLASAYLFDETLLRFVIFQALSMGCFGLVSGNLGARAMQPLGHIAGTASSVQGLITTVGGAVIGLLIGQSFDGTTLPVAAGFFVCAVAALLLSLWANRPEAEAAER